jgi:hypothetical protein
MQRPLIYTEFYCSKRNACWIMEARKLISIVPPKKLRVEKEEINDIGQSVIKCNWNHISKFL